MASNQNLNAISPAEIMKHMNKDVRVTIADGRRFEGLLSHMDGQYVHLSLTIAMREKDFNTDEERTYGYNTGYGYGYGYPGYGYGGYPGYGYGYGYPGYGYGYGGYPGSVYGSLILPLAAITAISVLR